MKYRTHVIMWLITAVVLSACGKTRVVSDPRNPVEKASTAVVSKPLSSPGKRLEKSPTPEPSPTPVPSFAVWHDRSAYSRGENPVTFQLEYNQEKWEKTANEDPFGAGYQLEHRRVPGCVIAQTLGHGLPFDVEVTKNHLELEDTVYLVTSVSPVEGKKFATYSTDVKDTEVLFKVSADERYEACRKAAERVLSTLE